MQQNFQNPFVMMGLALIIVVTLTSPVWSAPACQGIQLQAQEECTQPAQGSYITGCTVYHLGWSKIQAGYRIIKAGKTNSSFTVDVQKVTEKDQPICSITKEKKFHTEGWKITGTIIIPDRDLNMGMVGKKVRVNFGGPNTNVIPGGGEPLPVGPGLPLPD